ncbi:MAG: hypothetical protein ACJAUG_001158 [Halioglobus sp.]|jgi:hypothetical protein
MEFGISSRFIYLGLWVFNTIAWLRDVEDSCHSCANKKCALDDFLNDPGRFEIVQVVLSRPGYLTIKAS